MPLTENKNIFNWILFCLIFLIWGSSFVLMKLALFDSHGNKLFNVYQVAALRIICAAIVLLPVILRQWSSVPKKLTGYIFLSGIVGTLLPALLFCYAETRIDSALAGTLNSLTPVFTILIGAVFFKVRMFKYQLLGILTGFCGVLLLFLSGHNSGNHNVLYSGLVIVAVICYAVNIALVARCLKQLSSLAVVAYSLFSVAIPGLIILFLTGFFQMPLSQPVYIKGCLSAAALGIFGTALAWVIFFELARRTNTVFAASASYGIPFIALAWGAWYRESILLSQIGCLLIILGGVFLIRINNKRRKSANS